MTIENKAKAYDETIEKLRNFYRDYDIVSSLIDVKEELASLFPELQESEDERMLREIKRYIREQGNKPTGLPNGTATVADMLAWLEKQGEQKPVWSKEDEHKIKDIVYFLNTAKKHYASTVELDACIDWLKSLRPQEHYPLQQAGRIADLDMITIKRNNYGSN